ncbi:hypothetical protein PGTUg99_001289 [Puccinia graminis f. sp. tritici]|uniref:Uncharacterized protein n=1 Tax=Puccinia graminis f. sp. tritici TaxID=56615 RepID=A0A5B0NEV9_PUCGR|nr:hypothetical protein PGTUg99_001289 [Puccinia graminis f. sp. tritici]
MGPISSHSRDLKDAGMTLRVTGVVTSEYPTRLTSSHLIVPGERYGHWDWGTHSRNLKDAGSEFPT